MATADPSACRSALRKFNAAVRIDTCNGSVGTLLRSRAALSSRVFDAGLKALIRFHLDKLETGFLSSQTSSMRQPLKMLLTMTVNPLTEGCQQLARRS